MSTHSLKEAVLSLAGFTAALTCLHTAAHQASVYSTFILQAQLDAVDRKARWEVPFISALLAMLGCIWLTAILEGSTWITETRRGTRLLGCRVDVLDKGELLDDPLTHLQQQTSQPG